MKMIQLIAAVALILATMACNKSAPVVANNVMIDRYQSFSEITGRIVLNEKKGLLWTVAINNRPYAFACDGPREPELINGEVVPNGYNPCSTPNTGDSIYLDKNCKNGVLENFTVPGLAKNDHLLTLWPESGFTYATSENYLKFAESCD